ncbi:MAG: hypothetical protein J7501_18850, partial [Bdellovibrio sp.]|nr:hypothetical protein [Bdellovibrio sp.]
MKYVGSKLLTVLAFSSLLLTGCEDPGVNISTLGLKLAAPQLKGTNPFDQDFDSQNYAHIQGTCDTRVGDISISLNDNNWQTPPVTPDTTGTSLGSVTNDINCADGVFDVYLTKADLTSLWGITVAADGGTDVDSILIKGETIIGETKTLTLLDPKQSGSPGSGSGTA